MTKEMHSALNPCCGVRFLHVTERGGVAEK